MAKKQSNAQRVELYNNYVKDGIERWKQKYGSRADDDRGFLLWATELILEDLGELRLTDEQIMDACEPDGKWDLKVDSGHVDHEGKRVYLIQAKRWDPTKSVGDAPFFETWESLDLLSDPKRVERANSYTKDFYNEFAPAVQSEYDVVLCVATTGKVGQPQQAYVAQKPKRRDIRVGEQTYLTNVRFEVFSLERLIGIEKESIDDYSPPPTGPTELNCDGWYVVPSEVPGEGRSLYTTITDQQLVELRRSMKTALYKLNLRAPQDPRIAVNTEIRATLHDTPEMFHILNNGITAICDQFKDDEDLKVVKVWGLLVVNGCQTTETLFRNSELVIGKPRVKVNLRLVECQRSQASLIAKATNTQTRLRAEDYITLDPIQEQLQTQFKRLLPQPWYYEIKRREWKNLEAQNRREAALFKSEDGLPRVLSMRDAAQRSYAFLGAPIDAAQRTAVVFKEGVVKIIETGESEGGVKDTVFPKGLFPHQLLLPWKLYENVLAGVESFLDKRGLDEKESATVWLRNARLTVLCLVADALREHYRVQRFSYFSRDLSKKLIDDMEQWAENLIELALNTVWQHASNNTSWKDLGARAVFRRPGTYKDTLGPGFRASFNTIRPNLTLSLPPQ